MSTPAITFDGEDAARGEQPLCFVAQTDHSMRIGYYTDTYTRTPPGWRLQTRAMTFLRRSGARLRAPARSAASRAQADVRELTARSMDLQEFRTGLDAWLDEHEPELAAGFGPDVSFDAEMAHLSKVKRMTFDADWMRWGRPERVGGLGGSTLI